MPAPNQRLRGLLQSIPGGMVLGRKNGGVGDAGMIPISDLGQQIFTGAGSGNITFTDAGIWNNSTVYTRGQIVRYLDGWYLCIQNIPSLSNGLTIDGTVQGNITGTSGTFAALTTAHGGTVLYAILAGNSNFGLYQVTGLSSATTNTWTRYKRYTGPGNNFLEIWTGQITGGATLSSEVVTITTSDSSVFAKAAILGINAGSGFTPVADSNASNPGQGSGSATFPSVTFNSSQSQDINLYIESIFDTGGHSFLASPAGYASLVAGSFGNIFLNIADKGGIVAPQSGVVVNTGQTQAAANWDAVGLALSATTSAQTIPPNDTAHWTQLAAVDSYALDQQFGSAQGSILYRDAGAIGAANAWKAMGPGTAGYVFTTGGPSANPTWAVSSGGGGGSASTIAEVQRTSGSVSAGGSLTLTLGSTPTAGNILVAMGGGWKGGVRPPLGWVPIPGGIVLGTAGFQVGTASATLSPNWPQGADWAQSLDNQSIQCWYYIVQSGDPAAWTFNVSSDRFGIVLAEYSGVGSIKMQSHVYGAPGGSPMAAYAPLVTPEVTGEVVWIIVEQDGGATVTVSPGYTILHDLNTAASHEATFAKRDTTINPGVVETPHFTLTTMTTTSQAVPVATLRLIPYVSGGGSGSIVLPNLGGTGIANNAASTITISGSFGTTFTVTAATSVALPAGTHTLAGLDVAQTWSANQSYNSGNFILNGSTSGTLTVKPAAVAGSNTITLPAGTTDFSATGGASQVVKQASAGAAFTVGQLATTDLSDVTGHITYTPTVAAQSGTITTASASMLYQQLGGLLFFTASVSITTNGTGAGYVTITLPVAIGTGSPTGGGRESAITGKDLQYANTDSTHLAILNYDNTYPGANGALLQIAGFYFT